MKPRDVQTTTLSVDFGAGAPSEFCIWHFGANTTRNGYDVVFDSVSARAVMAAYKEHGVDVMIDLEHLSLDDKARNYDPDAVGWCRLEMRGADLWAVDVRWTPDGTRRLSEKTQRYISPAFMLDEQNRPTRLVNIALCAMPATDRIPALVAAKENNMADIDQVALAAALGVEIDPSADPMGFSAAMKAALEGVMAKFGGGESDPAKSEQPPAAEMASKAPPEEMAAAKAIMRVVGAKDPTEALLTVTEWRTLAVKHASETKRLADETKALEDTKRRSLTARLVVCGAELPATAWADESKTSPAAHLAKMSLDELEKRAEAFEALKGLSPSKRTPAAPQVHGLSARELAMCSETNTDPQVYAARKAALRKAV